MAVGDPNNPQGPGSQQPPLDPGVSQQFQGIGDKLRDADAMADSAKKYADEVERGANEVDNLGKSIKKEVDTYREFLKLTKKKLDDNRIERKELERVVQLGRESLKTMKAGSREYRQVTANLKEMEK